MVAYLIYSSIFGKEIILKMIYSEFNPIINRLVFLLDCLNFINEVSLSVLKGIVAYHNC